MYIKSIKILTVIIDKFKKKFISNKKIINLCNKSFEKFRNYFGRSKNFKFSSLWVIFKIKARYLTTR